MNSQSFLASLGNQSYLTPQFKDYLKLDLYHLYLYQKGNDTFFSQLPNSYMAYYSRGLARLREGNYSAANLDFEQAHILNPNDSNVLRWWACCEAHSGSFECAKKHANMAILLSPKDRGMHVAFLALAMCAFIQRENKEFELWANKAIQASPNAPIRRAMMIAYAAEMDNSRF